MSYTQNFLYSFSIFISVISAELIQAISCTILYFQRSLLICLFVYVTNSIFKTWYEMFFGSKTILIWFYIIIWKTWKWIWKCTETYNSRYFVIVSTCPIKRILHEAKYICTTIGFIFILMRSIRNNWRSDVVE